MIASELKKKTIDELKNYRRLFRAKEVLLSSMAEYNMRTTMFESKEETERKVKELSRNIALVTLEIEVIKDTLESLGYQDRRILEKFYVDRTPTSIAELMEEFNLEIAQIYRIKNRALDRYILAKSGKMTG